MKRYLLHSILGISLTSISCRIPNLGYGGYAPYTAPATYQAPTGYPYQAHSKQRPVYHQPRNNRYAQTSPMASKPANIAPVIKQPSSRYSSFDLGYPKIKTAPYTIRGIHYTPLKPQEALNYRGSGICSIYKGGSQNSISETSPPGMVTAAHKTLPLPCVVKVTNQKNGRTVYARVNDRGPFSPGRILDISTRGGEMLGFTKQGLTPVTVDVVSVGDGKLRIRK